MADGQITEAAMLRGLQDIRLPGEAAGGVLAEGLAALGLGLLLALALSVILRPLMDRKPKAHVETLDDRIEAALALPEGDRQLALLRLLAQHDAVDPAIYALDGLPDTDALLARLQQARANA